MNTELQKASNKEADSSLTDKLRQEVLDGLMRTNKSLPSKYLYDEAGDRLFQAIMAMPEYYVTDCELDIFKNQTAALSDIILRGGQPFDLIELGAGDAMKSSFLLKSLVKAGTQFTYRPIDISGHILEVLEDKLMNDIPELKIDSFAGEYFDMLAEATSLSARRKVVLFLGGNIGNMEWNEIRGFCKELNSHLAKGDMALIGFDLRKNPHTILNAYNDKTGITAAFNLNILNRLNRELEADFDLDAFQHYQTYDPISGACRSFLVCLKNQQVTIAEQPIAFRENELINIEVSQKFSPEEISKLADHSDFTVLENIKDSRGWFVDSAWIK